MKNPSPGSCFGGLGRPGEGTVPIGAALTTTIARVPSEATPTSDADRAPRPESTASAPRTADASTAGSGAARSATTTRAGGPGRGALRAPGHSLVARRLCPGLSNQHSRPSIADSVDTLSSFPLIYY